MHANGLSFIFCFGCRRNERFVLNDSRVRVYCLSDVTDAICNEPKLTLESLWIRAFLIFFLTSSVRRQYFILIGNISRSKIGANVNDDGHERALRRMMTEIGFN